MKWMVPTGGSARELRWKEACLCPAITQYPTFGRPIVTPSVATSLVDDVYLSLVAIPEENSDVVVVRVLRNPWWDGFGLGVL